VIDNRQSSTICRRLCHFCERSKIHAGDPIAAIAEVAAQFRARNSGQPSSSGIVESDRPDILAKIFKIF